MARVLLVDTNFSALPIRDWLRSIGHEVYVIGGNAADSLARADSAWRAVDYSDNRQLVGAVEELGIDYVVPGCNDRSYLSCSEASEHPAFHAIDPPATTYVINNKRAFREYAGREGLSVPKVFLSASPPPGMPVIVKPVDAFSGRGVTTVFDAAQGLANAIECAQRASATADYVVEEFVSGQLYSHSAFIRDGVVCTDFIVVEHCSANPYAVDTSYVMDGFPSAMLRRVREEVEHFARDLCLVDGLVHTQFISDGTKFWLIEVTRRCPGDLYSQLIELSTGFPYAAAYAAPFVGETIPAFSRHPHSQPILRHTITTMERRTLKDVRFHLPVVIDRLVPLAATGTALEQAPKGRVAVLFLQANDATDLRRLSDAAVQRNLYSFG